MQIETLNTFKNLNTFEVQSVRDSFGFIGYRVKHVERKRWIENKRGGVDFGSKAAAVACAKRSAGL